MTNPWAFIPLTRRNDGTEVMVRIDCIVALAPSANDDTAVYLIGDQSAFHVTEQAAEIFDLMREAFRGMTERPEWARP